jgi:hypothetical protein
MLGVPDSSYTEWLIRLDLHRLAMFGVGEVLPAEDKSDDTTRQADNVKVTLKKKPARGPRS